jgi:hypothetical protein
MHIPDDMRVLATLDWQTERNMSYGGVHAWHKNSVMFGKIARSTAEDEAAI